MKVKEILGTVSPLYGMATGKGLFGNAVGLAPAAAKEIREEEEKKRKEAEAKAKGMKKGGYVKAADGICKKGKTRGRMV